MAVASENVYQLVRDGILSGQFAEGQRLREAELSATFGVSRTPIREALRRLVAEGLLVGEPHKGVLIATLSEEEVQELFTLRALLEGFAAGRAAERITDEGMAQLLGLEAEMESIIGDADAGQDLRPVVELNTEFHELVFSFSANVQLISFIKILNHMPIAERTFRRYTEEGVRRSLACHKQILAALEARDPEWAEAAMRNHILSGRAMYLSNDAKPIC